MRLTRICLPLRALQGRISFPSMSHLQKISKRRTYKGFEELKSTRGRVLIEDLIL